MGALSVVVNKQQVMVNKQQMAKGAQLNRFVGTCLPALLC